MSEDVRPVTDLKTRAAELVDHVVQNRRPVLLTRRGRGVAMLLDVRDYERLLDRAALADAVQEAPPRPAPKGPPPVSEEAMEIFRSPASDSEEA